MRSPHHRTSDRVASDAESTHAGVIDGGLRTRRRPSVIAAVDRGFGGMNVARIAGGYAANAQARLVLATVGPAGGAGGPAGADHRDRRLAESVVVRARHEAGMAAEAEVLHGDPVQELLSLAHREDAGMLVLGRPGRDAGRRGRGGRQSLLGDTHLAVVGAAPCPICIVSHTVRALPATGSIICVVRPGDAVGVPSLGTVAAALAVDLRAPLRFVRVASRTRGLAEAGSESLRQVLQHQPARVIILGATSPEQADLDVAHVSGLAGVPVIVVPARLSAPARPSALRA